MIAPLLALWLAAVPPTDSMLITAAQLKARIQDPKLVLIQIGPRTDYDSAHIAGARYVPFSSLAAPRGTHPALELPAPAALDSALEALGISDDSRIVLYWTDEWISPTTRIYLTLTWFGLGSRVSILDGGLPAWRAVGGAVTKDAPTPAARGHLTPHPRNDVVVDLPFVRSQVDRDVWNIVDARTSEFYSGERSGSGDSTKPRFGHIPGAKSVPFTGAVDSTWFFLKPDAVKRMFSTAGVDLAKPIIVYCHVGQQATADWFAARLAGLDVRLYDGSFEDWSSHADLPVSGPAHQD